MNLSRRRLLELGLVGSAALLTRTGSAATTASPFTLGVASGYPTSGSVVLWTRLARAPEAPGGGMPAAPVPVKWELAEDEQFRRIARSGTVWAVPAEAHSLHVEPLGLEAARPYWYRFECEGHRSPVGRTATAAAPGSPLVRLRAAVVSCQHYEHGHYAAYRHLAQRDDVDLVVHLGDYIYEGSVTRPAPRRHNLPNAMTLEDYRNRYTQYRLDPSLQAAHAAAPWIAIWDDHEVNNDYAGDVSEDGDEPALFLQRRAAAYQAWYENLPVPRRLVPFGPYARIHTERVFGDLAQIHLLDGRQYRTRQACTPAGSGGARRVDTDCRELFHESRTMLGTDQEKWLERRLGASRARWNVLAQGTPMAWIDQDPAPDAAQYWTDSWSGYPAARDRLMQSLTTSRVANPVVLSGDVHAYGWSELHAKVGQPSGPMVAPEVITGSISSNAVAQSNIDGWRKDSPELKSLDGRKRGYTHLTFTRERMEAQFIAVEDQMDPQSRCDEALRIGWDAQ